jgi:hypothetical protein
MTDQQEALVADGFVTVPEALAFLHICRNGWPRTPRTALMELATAGLKGKERQT